jgi:beta-fructofuranosidase
MHELNERDYKVTKNVHLRPTERRDNAWFGDPVPFYWEGTYHLFYVWDQGHLVLPRVCHKWGHFASKDLIKWQEYPMAIEPGEEASCGTGSVFEKDGIFHMYYLGRYFTTYGVMYETICHATSNDLIHWQKDPENPISQPDLNIYSVKDWRDGYPIWNEEEQEYWMLVTASLNKGPDRLRGCIALMASSNLEDWKVCEPYWAPYLGSQLECPDLFQWNGWWYLLFSGEFGARQGTFYKRGSSIRGPWTSDSIDTFDGPLLYACKTAGNEQRRMLFGWIATREGNIDSGCAQWGGHGIVRELIQEEDGTLWVKCPTERLSLGEPAENPVFTPYMGEWTFNENQFIANLNYGISYAIAKAPKNMLFKFTFKSNIKTRRFGIFLCTEPNLSSGYRVDFDESNGEMSISSFGSEKDVHLELLTRPIIYSSEQKNTVIIILSDSILEVFVNDRTALTERIYNRRNNENLGIFVEDGGGTFSDFSMRKLPEDTW